MCWRVQDPAPFWEVQENASSPQNGRRRCGTVSAGSRPREQAAGQETAGPREPELPNAGPPVRAPGLGREPGELGDSLLELHGGRDAPPTETH